MTKRGKKSPWGDRKVGRIKGELTPVYQDKETGALYAVKPMKLHLSHTQVNLKSCH